MQDTCKTKFPIVLVHGVAVRDSRHFRRWGRIPRLLEANGAQIFYGLQDGWGTIESNATQLQKTINHILKITQSSRVNIIAHSKGGLDSRYLISTLNMGDKIASLTTIATPHHGLYYVDRLLKLPKFIFAITNIAVNIYYKILGDSSPAFAQVVRGFATTNAAHFNDINADSPKVFYQSYSAQTVKLSNRKRHLITSNDGENDGVVSTNSAKWSNYQGNIAATLTPTLTHNTAIDFCLFKPRKYNITTAYIDLVSTLKNMDF